MENEIIYTKLYNLWVEHDNLIGKDVDWNFAEIICDDYIAAKCDAKQMTDQEAQEFRAGWNKFTYKMFN